MRSVWLVPDWCRVALRQRFVRIKVRLVCEGLRCWWDSKGPAAAFELVPDLDRGCRERGLLHRKGIVAELLPVGVKHLSDRYRGGGVSVCTSRVSGYL